MHIVVCVSTTQLEHRDTEQEMGSNHAFFFLKSMLGTFVLRYIYQNPDSQPFIITAQAQLFAIITKLGWLENEEFRALVDQIQVFFQVPQQVRERFFSRGRRGYRGCGHDGSKYGMSVFNMLLLFWHSCISLDIPLPIVSSEHAF